jgi:flagellar assembly protein FliH
MAIRNVPAPSGSKAASSYQRFIPREELGDFATWKPGSFGDGTLPERRAQPRAEPPAPTNTAAPPKPVEPTAAEWQTRITAARQAGYQEGYRDGLVALESFKQSFAQQTTAQVGQLLQAFDEQLNQLDGKMAAALAQTAVQLARQVLRAELHTQPELVAKVASEAVAAVMLSAQHISVQVHPLDLPWVNQGAADVLAARGARLVANAQIERGGVLVQSDVGHIDARLDVRWRHAAAALGSLLPVNDSHDMDEDAQDDTQDSGS